MSKIVSFGINVDASEIIKLITSSFQRSSYNERWYDNNKGRWISCQVGGYLISANYHQTEQHSATAQGRSVSKSIAPAGKWAIAYTNNSQTHVNKTNYDYGSHLM